MNNLKIVLSAEQIGARIRELGAKITKDYTDKEPVLICMLKGAVIFYSDLVRCIELPITMDFARISSYKNGTASGELDLISDITTDIKGKDVILVEDIVDTGKTLYYYCNELKKKQPNSIKVCALMDKKERREVPFNVDYIGFDIPSGFVIGYGLDYAEHYREIPFIGEVIDPSLLK